MKMERIESADGKIIRQFQAEEYGSLMTPEEGHPAGINGGRGGVKEPHPSFPGYPIQLRKDGICGI